MDLVMVAGGNDCFGGGFNGSGQHQAQPSAGGAAAWLLNGQYAKAADAATVSLKGWPADPLALLILSRAEDGLGRAADARHDDASAIGNWQRDIAKVDVAVI